MLYDLKGGGGPPAPILRQPGVIDQARRIGDRDVDFAAMVSAGRSTPGCDLNGLYQELRMPAAAPGEDLTAAYRSGDRSPQARLAYSVLCDPLYRALYTRKGLVRVRSAGWFDDGLEPEERTLDLDWLTSPLPGDVHLAAGGRLVALVSTGAFDPVHEGHIAMMAAARRHVEARGDTVVAAYLAPDHDGYVSTKRSDSMPAQERLRQARLATAEVAWLDVDPWPALFMAPVAFTVVVRRLQEYLHRHCAAARIQVVYVCGSDNARFAEAFPVDQCVVVERPGCKPASYVRPTVDGSVKASSTAVRAAGFMPSPGPHVERFQLRDDIELATRRLRTAGEESFDARLAAFRETLIDALTLVAPVRVVPAIPPIGVDGPTISMDVWWNGTHNLGVSRFFRLADGQVRPIGVIARPGTPPISDQLAAIPAGHYALVDDDVATGTSTRAAIEMLAEHSAVVTSVRTLIETRPGDDVLDARDFLIGAEAGGLVATVGGRITRLPYLPPWVDLTSRASVPSTLVHKVGHLLWRACAQFYRGSGLVVGDVDPHTAALLNEAGFTHEARMEDVCRLHVQWLRS